MTDLVIVSGFSDDIISVEGDLNEELRPEYPAEEEGVYVALSCGVLLKVRYDGDWSVSLTSDAEAESGVVQVQHHKAHIHDLEGTRDYSDAAIVEAESIDWVVMGEQASVAGGEEA